MASFLSDWSSVSLSSRSPPSTLRWCAGWFKSCSDSLQTRMVTLRKPPRWCSWVAHPSRSSLRSWRRCLSLSRRSPTTSHCEILHPWTLAWFSPSSLFPRAKRNNRFKGCFLRTNYCLNRLFEGVINLIPLTLFSSSPVETPANFLGNGIAPVISDKLQVLKSSSVL